jgi:hypothetical protein
MSAREISRVTSSDYPNLITAKGVNHALLEGIFWHVAHPGWGMLFHNARNNEGLLPSISAANQAPGQEDMFSLQSLKGQSDPKELIWERVRKEMDAKLPTRNGAFFVVAEEIAARFISDKWFRAQNRHIIATRILKGSTVFQADANWLDCSQNDWESNAHKYWAGEMSDRPIREMLVHGCVYFPGWKKPPFGFMGMPSIVP